MSNTDLDEMYYKIAKCNDEIELLSLGYEIEQYVRNTKDLDRNDSLLLQATFRIKALEISVISLAMLVDLVLSPGNSSGIDLEAERLNELEDAELDDLKNGNVVLIDNFNKRDKDD